MGLMEEDNLLIRTGELAKKKVGVVVAKDFWDHFRFIFEEMQRTYEVSIFRFRRWPFQVFSERVNRKLLQVELSQFLRANDLVFFEWGEDFFVCATMLPKHSKIVARLHLHELWDTAPRADWSKVDQVIFVSHAMKRKFSERFPDAAWKAQTVHNGVKVDQFRPKEREFQGVIGMLGRIEPHKRVYDLILVLNDLRMRGYDLRLKIGGSCTEPRYQRYADEASLLAIRLGVEEWVDFDGQIYDTAEWLRQIDIFVSHSTSEGLQVALLEAMATGCYCLSHAWDGVEEVLPPENIYWGERELIAKIEGYSNATDKKREEEKLKLRKIAEEQFTIESQKMKILGIIQQVIEDR